MNELSVRRIFWCKLRDQVLALLTITAFLCVGIGVPMLLSRLFGTNIALIVCISIVAAGFIWLWLITTWEDAKEEHRKVSNEAST